MKKFVALALIAITIAAPAFAKPKPKEQVKGQVVDSGSWGIFVNGKRVATEKFQIEQTPTVSTITTETKTDDGSNAAQKSEMQISSTGELQRYEWQEVSPGKANAVVEPSNEFLVEHMKPNLPDPARDIPFLVSNSTPIVDDNIFTHREVLTWRYLANNLGGSCETKDGKTVCNPQKSSFGVLVPKEGVSDAIAVLYTGKQAVNIRGKEQQLDRFELTSEATGTWVVWMDDQKKVLKIDIPDANTEVVRD